jgi:hypothetical protein
LEEINSFEKTVLKLRFIIIFLKNIYLQKYDGHTRFKNITAAIKELVRELGKIIINIGVFQNLQTTKKPINQIFMRFNDGADTQIRTMNLLITTADN